MKGMTLAVFLLSLPAPVGGQDQGADPRQRGLGYVFLAAGMCQHGVLLGGTGGGGEVAVYRGLTVGGDAGAYSFTDTYAFGVGAVNATYHFAGPNRRRGPDPFITGGWSMAFAPGGFYGGGANVGGGLNYWVRDRVGIRWEARGHTIDGEFMLISRFGFSFR
jgi:hypothetical protein